MAVTLPDEVGAIGSGDLGSWAKDTIVASEAHRSSEIRDTLLLLHQVDDLVRRRGVDLGRMGIMPAQHVAGELDDHALHPETDT